MRLAKYLAAAGIASRRKAEAIIINGRVRVNGRVIKRPQHDVGADDIIALNGRLIAGVEPKEYILLHKPAGYITTVKDTHNRAKVTDLLTDIRARLYPVGRLDADTSGALLLTNDGKLSYRLTHPRYQVEKLYRVLVRGLPDQKKIKMMSRGINIDGEKTAPAKVKLIGQDRKKQQALLEITLKEGRKRQVKKMCAAVGHPVEKLHRISFAGLQVYDLPEGSHRRLDSSEVARLYRLVGLVSC